MKQKYDILDETPSQFIEEEEELSVTSNSSFAFLHRNKELWRLYAGFNLYSSIWGQYQNFLIVPLL